MSTFEQVDKTRCADVAEADLRALCAVVSSATIKLSPITREELVKLAIEARSWIPAERLEQIDSEKLARMRGL